jgi:hypothetical protein
MSIELRTPVAELASLCRRVQELARPHVHANLSLPIEAALPGEKGMELGGAAFDPKRNRIVIWVEIMLARPDEEQEAVVLHEIGHALIYARAQDRTIEFDVPADVVDWVSEEAVADMFACICGREEAIARVQERFGERYRACLKLWRDPISFRNSVHAYVASRSIR